MKRWLTVLVSVLAILVIGLAILLGTTPGLRIVLGLADRVSGETVHVMTDRVEGRLFGRLAVDNLVVTAPGIDLQLTRAELDWRPLALLSGRIEVRQLLASNGQLSIQGGKAQADSDPGGGIMWLPVATLDKLQVDNLDITTESQTHRVEHFTARAELRSGRLSVSQLDLRMPDLQAGADGEIDLLQQDITGLRVNWHWQPGDLQLPISGTATAKGNSRRMELALDLQSPTQARLQATLKQLPDAPHWQADLRVEPVNLQRDVRADLPDVEINLALDMTGDSETARLNGTGSVTFDAIERPWRVDAQLPLTGETYPNLIFESGQSRLSLTADTSVSDRAELRIAVPKLSELWPGLSGSLSADGTLTGAPRQPVIELALDGSSLAFAENSLASLHGRLELDTALGIDSPLRLSAELGYARMAGIGFDAELRVAGTPQASEMKLVIREQGATSLSLDMTGGVSDGTLLARLGELQIEHPELGAWISDTPSELKLGRDGGQLSRLCLKQQQASLCANAEWLDSRLSLQTQFQAIRLEQLPLPAGAGSYQLAGALDGQMGGTLDGSRVEKLDLAASLEDGYVARRSDDGSTRSWHLDRLTVTGTRIDDQLQAEAHMSDRQDGNLIARLALPADLQLLRDASAPVSGSLVASLPHLENLNTFLDQDWIPQGQLQADLRFSGKLESPRFSGQASMEMPAITLGEPATVLRQNRLTLELDDRQVTFTGRGLLDEKPLQIAGKATLTDLENWQAEVQLTADGVQLASLPMLQTGDEFQLDGLLSTRLELALDQRLVLTRLDGTLELRNGLIQRTYLDGDREQLAINRINLLVGLQDENIQLNGELQDDEVGKLSLSFGLPADLTRFDEEQLTLAGRLEADMPRLQAFAILLDDVRLPAGRLEADVRLAGTRANPQLSGKALLDVPELALEEPAIRLLENRIDIRLAGNDLTMQGRSQVNGKPVQLAGEAELQSIESWQARLNLDGQSLQLDNIYGSSLVTSPDLVMLLEPGLVYLSGKLAIEGSEIVVPDMTSSIRPSNDVRIVGDTATETKTWRIKTELAVSLTGDNRLRVAGFNGLLTGNMRIRSETGQLTTGEGTLNVSEGVYRAFGATVPIRRGQIEFIGGALDDPAINIISRRVVEQREVGFDVTGTLKAPVVTLVSNPAMDQSEILSWLLYGRGGDDVSGAASAVLVDTIRQSLGSEEEESFIQRILSRTGLANTGIEVTSDLTSGVGVSKQLSPRMRVKYQVDIWDQTTRLILRYQLNEHWALEGVSGDLGGADILYERER